MTERRIDHGDAVEVRYTILVAADDLNVVILRPDLVSDAVERENVYFLRRHKDGQLCDGHLHESLDDARACIDRTKLDGLWQDLTRIMADIQRQVNAEYAEYRSNGGTLSGDEWLEQRNQERNRPQKRRPRNAAPSTSELSTDSSTRPTLRRMARRKKDERRPSLAAMILELCRAKPRAKLHRHSFVLVYLPYPSLAGRSPSLLDLFFSQPSSTGGKSGFSAWAARFRN